MHCIFLFPVWVEIENNDSFTDPIKSRAQYSSAHASLVQFSSVIATRKGIWTVWSRCWSWPSWISQPCAAKLQPASLDPCSWKLETLQPSDLAANYQWWPHTSEPCVCWWWTRSIRRCDRPIRKKQENRNSQVKPRLIKFKDCCINYRVAKTKTS